MMARDPPSMRRALPDPSGQPSSVHGRGRLMCARQRRRTRQTFQRCRIMPAILRHHEGELNAVDGPPLGRSGRSPWE